MHLLYLLYMTRVDQLSHFLHEMALNAVFIKVYYAYKPLLYLVFTGQWRCFLYLNWRADASSACQLISYSGCSVYTVIELPQASKIISVYLIYKIVQKEDWQTWFNNINRLFEFISIPSLLSWWSVYFIIQPSNLAVMKYSLHSVLLWPSRYTCYIPANPITDFSHK